MRARSARLAVVAALVATLAPGPARAQHAGDVVGDAEPAVDDALRRLGHAFIAYDPNEFTDFLATFEFSGLADAAVTEVETELYNPFKGDVTLDPTVALGARIDYRIALVTNPWPYEVPNPTAGSTGLRIGLDGTTALDESGTYTQHLPPLAGSTHPDFAEMAASFSDGFGVPLGGTELAANGAKLASILGNAPPEPAPVSAVFFLGSRTSGRSDDMGCGGLLRDRAVFVRQMPGLETAERPVWDDTTGADSTTFNDSFLNGNLGLINNCGNNTTYEPPIIRRFAGPGQGFVDSPANAATFIGPYGWFSMFLATDVPDIEGIRLIDFVTDGAAPFTPDTTAGSIWPDDFSSFAPVGDVPALVIDPTLTAEPAPEAEPEPETPTEDTSDEPAAEPAPSDETATEPETVSEPEPSGDTSGPTTDSGDGGGFPWGWALIVIGLALITIALIWMFWFGGWGRSNYRDPGPTRTRTRRRYESTPPGVTPPHETTSCDWALYFADGGNRTVLREAKFPAIECCVYDISVATTVLAHEQVAKARQDDDGERLRIFDLDFPWTWVGLDAHASTRSGPLGRLDWMQGLGDPTDQSVHIPADPYWQGAQGEEPPEGTISLLHVEFTRVLVNLTPKCPEYENLYTYNAETKLDMMSTVECTNEAHDPECGVELNAFGGGLGAIVGDVATVLAVEVTGTDPDELERAGRRMVDGFDPDRADDISLTPARPLWDGHDHTTRDRLTYEADHTDRSSDVVESDGFVAYILTIADLHSGQIVPLVAYPTTERVSTHIEYSFDHSLKIIGEMKSEDCESNGCGGHGPCACNPKFTLTVARSGSWIDVDGDQYPILRIPTSADRNSPPAPGAARPWELQK